MKLAKSDTQPSPHFLMESATVDYAHADIRKLASCLGRALARLARRHGEAAKHIAVSEPSH